MSEKPTIIIGNGIAGITAARNIRKNSNQPVMIISKESQYFFSRTALMYVYMGHMQWAHLEPYESSFWKKNNLQLYHGEVSHIDPEKKCIRLKNGDALDYNTLIIATGSVPNRFGWKGENLKAVQGLYSKQDLETLEQWTPTIQKAVIVGGGLIGIELAEMLHSRGISVTFLVRESSFWNNVLPKEESEMINQHILDHGIDLRLNTELKEIESDAQGRAKGVISSTGEHLDCQWVGLTAGVRPNIDWLQHSKIKTNRGILVDEFLQTEDNDIYAIGDCAELKNPPPGRRPIEAVWYTGRMMGETVAQTLNGNPKKYTPGHWFNSAKFFDIEYQTYGQVNPIVKEDEGQFYWQKAGENKAIRLAYRKSTLQLLGINAMGIRLRHEVCDQWLNQEATINQVIADFAQANFDPEFFPIYELEIQKAWQEQL